MVAIVEDAKRARDHIATLALSMYQLHGLPAPSSDELGGVVARAEASMSLHQLRHPESINASAIGQIDQLVLSAADAKKRPTNLYSADAARLGQAGDGLDKGSAKGFEPFERLRALSAGTREVSGGSAPDRSGSGARFDDLGTIDWGSPAGLAKMRDYAIQTGLPWAANNPELLRLGPAAVGALAAVQFKQETYKQLTSDASFKAKDVVTLARFAKEQHVDANTLGTSFAKVEKEMTPQERARFNGAVVPYMADPKNPERRDKAVKAFEETEKAHPEKHQELETLREQLNLKGKTLEHAKGATAAKDSQANGEASRTADKKRDATDKLGMLDAEPAAKPSPAPAADKSKPPTTAGNPQPQKPVAPKPAAAPSPH